MAAFDHFMVFTSRENEKTSKHCKIKNDSVFLSMLKEFGIRINESFCNLLLKMIFVLRNPFIAFYTDETTRMLCFFSSECVSAYSLNVSTRNAVLIVKNSFNCSQCYK